MRLSQPLRGVELDVELDWAGRGARRGEALPQNQPDNALEALYEGIEDDPEWEVRIDLLFNNIEQKHRRRRDAILARFKKKRRIREQEMLLNREIPEME
jgi:hypothetical protein